MPVRGATLRPQSLTFKGHTLLSQYDPSPPFYDFFGYSATGPRAHYAGVLPILGLS